MFNLVRMDLRRLLRTRSFYIILAVWAALLLMLVLLVVKVTDPEALDAMQESGMVVVEGDRQMSEEIRGMTQLEFIYECLGSGFLLVMAGLGVTLFVNGDFSSGCIKNICFAQPQRWKYVFAKALTAGIYSGVLVALSIVLLLVSPSVFGLNLARDGAADILQYAFWLWLVCWCFGLMALSLVLLTRSSTMGIILSVLAGSGLITALLQTLCQKFGWPKLSQYLISSVAYDQCVPWLGANEIGMILACVAGWGVVYMATGLAVMEKQDV